MFTHMPSWSACAPDSNLPVPAAMVNSSAGRTLGYKDSAPLLYQYKDAVVPSACAPTVD